MTEKIGHESPRMDIESHPLPVITPPAVESLLQSASQDSPWPEEIVNNPELVKQRDERFKLAQQINSCYEKMPKANMNIETGLRDGLVEEHEIAALYDSIAHLLESDPENNRIVLYFPFELIPNEQEEGSPEFSEAKERFTRAYKQAWNELLSTPDLRADFSDGDVPEVEHRTAPLPQVVKAAHLIPQLVERKFITPKEVLDTLEGTSDELLANSILDALRVLGDTDSLSEEDLDRMSHSQKRIVANMAILIRSDRTNVSKETLGPTDDLSHISSHLASDITRITDTYNTTDPGMTAARQKWLTGVETDRTIALHAAQLGALLSLSTQNVNDLTEYLSSHKETQDKLFVAQAILETVKKSVQEDEVHAAQNYQIYEPLLTELWVHGGGEIHDALESIYLHLFELHVIKDETLKQLGIAPPTFDAPFGDRMTGMKTDLDDINKITTSIESNEELSKIIYPVAVILGSRMKGYGRDDADLDVAVFVRPGVPFEERAHLQTLISETFTHDKIGGKAMEFWLEADGDELSIQNFENPDSSLGDSSLPHPLLGAWCGDRGAIEELYKKLMPGYLYSKGKTIDGEAARHLWLKQMEHNTLQYRLMHKGYQRFFPEQGGIHTAHSDEIDGDSTFYDSGYRRLATKLFLDRVFLPQLEKSVTKE